MKHLLVLFLSLNSFIYCYAQKPSRKTSNPNDGELIVGGILLGGGTISLATGFLSKTGNTFLQAIANDKSKNTAGDVFLIAGAASVLVGALLLIDGIVKEKKRFDLAISLPKYTYANVYCHIPTVSLSVKFCK